ncbi:DUF262 domain-containing protein [Mangrovibacterium lignilyticum]|uniref:DUF262 domain-containing protein n=1 Tax=Mangrovibacterium lignilyticum TaxID=2668052 RepID=UPI0013D3D5D2|nr:DUF262 domain-containing protein [Mangrovibacterium lignilyticum]
MKAKLESGKQYSLTDLFGGERRVIIPDLQRDYCWGDQNHGANKTELVSGFLSNLIDLFKSDRNRDHQLGMIYAYENPVDHIHLCDGQQRITTLYLFLGMLYRYVDNEEGKSIQNFLMSDFERTDDREPHLQYAIRESTLYFLSDLVYEFFFNSELIEVEAIKNAKWYFADYNQDPTIQSMLNALALMEDIIRNITNHRDLANFLLERIKFFYFDMVNRQHGEEMFVVINTTGEPLTPTENLKPILVNAVEEENQQKEASDIWEKWEKWFWLNRLDGEHEADAGLNQFLIWYWQIKLRQESDWSQGKKENLKPQKLFKERPVRKNEDENSEFSVISESDWEKARSIKEVDKYFEQYTILNSYIKVENFRKVLNFERTKPNSLRNFSSNQAQDIIVPMFEFMVRFPEEDQDHWYFFRRLRKNYYDGNEWEDRNQNYVDWRHILEIIGKSEDSDSVLKYEKGTEDLKKIPNVRSNISRWYNHEAKRKERLIESGHRVKVEAWEDHQDFMGDLSLLFEVDDVADRSDIDEILRLEDYYRNYTNTIDLLRNQYNGEDISKRKLSNLFRLFRLFSGCSKVGHISRVSWEIEGVLFSKIKNREHFNNAKFKELCSSRNLEKYSETYIIEKLNEWNLLSLDENNYSVERYIKAWLTLKVFRAVKENEVLAYYDGNDTGVAAYIDMKRNLLIKETSFSLQNSMCGFAVKNGRGGESYVRYTDDIHWQKNSIIDTPFCGIERKDDLRTISSLEENRKEIDQIIDYIYSYELCCN